MAKIFAAQAELNNHPSRNNFDLSHKVHMSGKAGVLYPDFCKLVVPGDTFRISSALAINLMPMPYPTQTRMRFIQHFFYVRLKNIWPNFENWVQGLEEHVPPYISQSVDFFKTGSLADFLDIPTTLVEGGTVAVEYSFGLTHSAGENDYGNGHPLSIGQNMAVSDVVDLNKGAIQLAYSVDKPEFVAASRISTVIAMQDTFEFVTAGDMVINQVYMGLFSFSTEYHGERTFYGSDLVAVSRMYGARGYVEIDASNNGVEVKSASNIFYKCSKNNGGFIQVSDEVYDFDSEARVYCVAPIIELFTYPNFNGKGAKPVGDFVAESQFDIYALSQMAKVFYDVSGVRDITEVPSASPYYKDNTSSPDSIKVSALPFRAYESIYNAFYRNQNGNQPFVVNGRTQYNKYNTTTEDGADKTDYQLMYRNWELDAYTSCLPSPQQGPAPVVGISALGDITITDPETGVTSTARATDTPNGMSIDLVNAQSVEHQRYLVNLATSGITINDFRQVNALQRFLETNIRKGYRYMDFIEGHFGVKIKGAVLDMPEFLGGYSETVQVGKVTNMVGASPDNTGYAPLGDYAGQGSAFGGSKHSITHYCDDYGFIVGIMCLVPDPCYSQILPKHFNIKQPLDLYFPEFAQIGLQPLTYEELCPIQSHNQYNRDGQSKLTDVFGYQRPNHDLVWYPDTMHGQFRLSLKDYVVNRLFSERPELGNEFLTIKPEETNSIFAVTEAENDVFVGQIAFDVKAKRPVPRIVIPGLGR